MAAITYFVNELYGNDSHNLQEEKPLSNSMEIIPMDFGHSMVFPKSSEIKINKWEKSLPKTEGMKSKESG